MLDLADLRNPFPQFTADELLNLAIVSKLPVFIVEGYDDIPIFERIAEDANISCDIHASETLKDGCAGCMGVIKGIEVIRGLSGGLPVEKHVLGIIDQDARVFRGEVPADPAVFMLDYNSIESHYVHANTVEYLIPQVTRASPKLMGERISTDIFSGIAGKLNGLYYVSLEALKNSCDETYNSLFGYKQTIHAITNQGLDLKVLERKDDLDAFASLLGISCCFDDLLLICKGKWLLDTFGQELCKAIINLPVLCGESKIPQCQLCRVDDKQKRCMYKKSMSFNVETLLGRAYMNTNIPTLNYIKDKFRQYSMS
jgi:hypothetical protein